MTILRANWSFRQGCSVNI